MNISKLAPDDNHMPRCIRGFSHINRYWDKLHNTYAAKILPGEYYVTISDEVIVTVLGSCVSACVRDKVFGIGGMNHFMLPASKQQLKLISKSNESTRYGNFAMEQMINDILKNGGRRENLEVKLFGGAKVIQNMSTMDIGRRNIDFVREYIDTESIELVSEDLGDICPRKVMFYPASGRVRVKRLRSMHNDTIIKRESTYMSTLEEKPVEGDIELF